METLFDYAQSLATAQAEATGIQLRDAGTSSALEHAGEQWRTECVSLIRRTMRGSEAIAEDFRMLCESAQLFAHHPNAWGALTLHMKRQGLLRETGEWRKPTDAKSHARPTRVYIVQ
jgi:hypothetical protein